MLSQNYFICHSLGVTTVVPYPFMVYTLYSLKLSVCGLFEFSLRAICVLFIYLYYDVCVNV